MNILIEVIICMLAAYGLLIILIGSADLIRCANIAQRPDVRVVLIVKNAENNIEHIIRNAIKSDFASKMLSEKKLGIVDMNSKDKTYKMLEKLEKDFSNIEVLTFDERELIFDDFSIFSREEK